MKITLDIDQLLHDGRITPEEHQRLRGFAAETTSSLALNLILAFGIIAVAGGTVALLQSAAATVALGLVLAAVGGGLGLASPRWRLLGNILLPLGALTGAAGILIHTEGSADGFGLVAALFLAGAIAARSGLLASLSVFACLAALGGATGYEHAAYYLCIEHPLLTILVFTALGGAAYGIGRAVPAEWSRLADIFARTAAVVVNFGFWVGSLWGDRHAGLPDGSEVYFIVGWALCILAAGVWGVYSNHRWLVNTAATFGAIHLYTQWFERLGADPVSVIVAGGLLIVAAYALISYNRSTQTTNALPNPS